MLRKCFASIRNTQFFNESANLWFWHRSTSRVALQLRIWPTFDNYSPNSDKRWYSPKNVTGWGRQEVRQKGNFSWETPTWVTVPCWYKVWLCSMNLTPSVIFLHVCTHHAGPATFSNAFAEPPVIERQTLQQAHAIYRFVDEYGKWGWALGLLLLKHNVRVRLRGNAAGMLHLTTAWAKGLKTRVILQSLTT